MPPTQNQIASIQFRTETEQILRRPLITFSKHIAFGIWGCHMSAQPEMYAIFASLLSFVNDMSENCTHEAQ